MKLHLGCGNKHKKGYINIDIKKTDAVDLICDARKLPYKENTIEIIESYHLIEHIPYKDAVSMLKSWYNILKVGGKIIIECPDFDRDIKEYLEGNEYRLNNIFGLQRWYGDFHYWGWNIKRLSKLLKEIGFINIISEEAQDYHSKGEPCIHIEAEKGEK